MNKHLRDWVPVLLWWVVFFALGAAYHFRTITNYGVNALTGSLMLIDAQPAGEIVASFELEAELLPVRPELAEVYSQEEVCIATRVATYGNRVNRGHVRMELITRSKRQSQLIDVRHLRDNQVINTCFDNIHFQDMRVKFDGTTVQQPRLRLTGEDGLPGSAITVWLTQTDNAPATLLNGKKSPAGLAYAIGHQLPAKPEKWAAVLMLAVASLLAAIVTRAALSGNHRRDA